MIDRQIASTAIIDLQEGIVYKLLQAVFTSRYTYEQVVIIYKQVYL